jgi:hypothetical protein
VDLDAVADELYGLWPGEFTAARTEREKEARAAGDKELARQVKALGRPTTVGWLANRLVRDHGDELQPLLELGDALREATAVLQGEELRALSQQQHQLVAALVRQARRDAAGSGHRVGEDAARGLEETLRAALADADLSAQLAAGRLTGGLQHSGFGGPSGAGGGGAGPARRTAAPAGKPGATAGSKAGGTAGSKGGSTAGGSASKTPASSKDAAAERARERREKAAARKQAERDLADARKQAAAAATAHAEAKAAVDEAATAAAAAASRAAELRTEIEQVSRDQAAAERRRRAAEPEVAAATKAVRGADRLVRARTAELEDLD